MAGVARATHWQVVGGTDSEARVGPPPPARQSRSTAGAAAARSWSLLNSVNRASGSYCHSRVRCTARTRLRTKSLTWIILHNSDHNASAPARPPQRQQNLLHPLAMSCEHAQSWWKRTIHAINHSACLVERLNLEYNDKADFVIFFRCVFIQVHYYRRYWYVDAHCFAH